MTQSSARWFFRARGLLPNQDYTWTDARGTVARDAAALANPAARLETGGALTIAMGFWQPEATGILGLFVDGLTSLSWPREAAGRNIELAVLGVADSPVARRELIAILRTVMNELSGQRIDRLVEFNPSKTSTTGYTINQAVWMQLTGEPIAALSEDANVDRAMTWGPRSQTAEFVEDASALVLSAEDLSSPTFPTWILAVSDRIGVGWCAENLPLRAASDQLGFARREAWGEIVPAVRSQGGGGHPKVPRRSARTWMAALLYILLITLIILSVWYLAH